MFYFSKIYYTFKKKITDIFHTYNNGEELLQVRSWEDRIYCVIYIIFVRNDNCI